MTISISSISTKTRGSQTEGKHTFLRFAECNTSCDRLTVHEMTALYFVRIRVLADSSAKVNLRCKHCPLSESVAWLSSCEVDEKERSVSGGLSMDSGDIDMVKRSVQQKVRRNEYLIQEIINQQTPSWVGMIVIWLSRKDEWRSAQVESGKPLSGRCPTNENRTATWQQPEQP